MNFKDAANKVIDQITNYFSFWFWLDWIQAGKPQLYFNEPIPNHVVDWLIE